MYPQYLGYNLDNKAYICGEQELTLKLQSLAPCLVRGVSWLIQYILNEEIEFTEAVIEREPTAGWTWKKKIDCAFPFLLGFDWNVEETLDSIPC